MSRAQRLLDLVQILRQNRYPVTAATLAHALNVSVRTLYRDIVILQEHGATIEGEAGLGYVLRPGFMLPPLMFSEEEIEAIVLGSQWVASRGDVSLRAAAKNALSKIAAVLPSDLRVALDTSALHVVHVEPIWEGDAELPLIRRAIRSERKLAIQYRDVKGSSSERTIWPLALGFFERTRVIAAWCELRQSFRHFRADRIGSVTVLEERYPKRRQILLREWRETEKIPVGRE